MPSDGIIKFLHDQMETHPRYPFNVRTQWMPAPGHPAMREFFEKIENCIAEQNRPLDPSVQALGELIEGDVNLSYLMNNACRQNANIHDSQVEHPQVCFPQIKNLQQLLTMFNHLLETPPHFMPGDQLVGLPFSAVVVGIDPTQSGSTLFGLPDFNTKMRPILNKWHIYLGTTASNWVFGEEGKQWLLSAAKKSYQFELWKKENDSLPYWNSWNTFFTREFKDPATVRPIDAPDDNKIVCSANGGSLFRWDDNIKKSDECWFKDMPYSLIDIFTASTKQDLGTIDK